MSVTGGMGVLGKRLETQFLSLLERLEEKDTFEAPRKPPSMMSEVRTLELWRAVIAECLATVFYVFLVCGSYNSWIGVTVGQEPQARIVVSLVSGLAMVILIQSFSQVSGGHLNPAVSIGFALTRKVSPLRAAMFVLAQLGGGIAGAALLYGATSSGYTGDLGATDVSSAISVWQGFAVEFLLTLIVVFVAFASLNPFKKTSVSSKGSPAISIGLAYMTCTLVGFPLTGASMNPARSLGPAFVMNKWKAHWIYWVGPILGGITASLIYEYIFNPSRIAPSRKDTADGECSSVASEDDPYDTCSKGPPRYGYNGLPTQQYSQYQLANTTTHSPLDYSQKSYGSSRAASVYNGPPFKLTENGYGKNDIYSGSKSMYTNSPPLPRSTSLNRSQSVYTRPTPPRSDNYYRNLAQSQNLTSKSPNTFTSLLQPNQFQENATSQYARSNDGQIESLYVTSKPGLVKPEPIYGTGVNSYNKHNPDSGDSSYSTYRGSSSYSSSQSSSATPAHQSSVIEAAPRSHRNEARTPSSVVSGRTSRSYHSPNPHY